jgi:hypothetical protein
MSGAAGDSGESNAVVILGLEDPAGDLPYQAAVVYSPVEIDGIEVSACLLGANDNAQYYVRVRADDPAQARKVLESLTLTGDGLWQDAAAASGLPTAADAEQTLSEGADDLGAPPPEVDPGEEAGSEEAGGL